MGKPVRFLTHICNKSERTRRVADEAMALLTFITSLGTVYKIDSECHMMILIQHAASKALECDEVAARTLRWYQRPMKRRYLIASLAFFGFCIIYMLRVNLSVAIVAMTANKTHLLENGTTITVRQTYYLQCS